MKKRAIVALIVIITLSGCLGLTDTKDTKPGITEENKSTVLENMKQSHLQTDNYTIQANMNIQTQQKNKNRTSTLTASVDKINRKINSHIKQNTDTSSPFSLEIYWKEGESYINNSGVWTKRINQNMLYNIERIGYNINAVNNVERIEETENYYQIHINNADKNYLRSLFGFNLNTTSIDNTESIWKVNKTTYRIMEIKTEGETKNSDGEKIIISSVIEYTDYNNTTVQKPEELQYEEDDEIEV